MPAPGSPLRAAGRADESLAPASLTQRRPTGPPWLLKATVFSVLAFPPYMVLEPVGASSSLAQLLALGLFGLWALSSLLGLHDPVAFRHPGRAAVLPCCWRRASATRISLPGSAGPAPSRKGSRGPVDAPDLCGRRDRLCHHRMRADRQRCHGGGPVGSCRRCGLLRRGADPVHRPHGSRRMDQRPDGGIRGQRRLQRLPGPGALMRVAGTTCTPSNLVWSVRCCCPSPFGGPSMTGRAGSRCTGPLSGCSCSRTP